MAADSPLHDAEPGSVRWQGLVERAKAGALESDLTAGELAAEFGLDEGFVEDVIQNVESPTQSRDLGREFGQLFVRAMQEAWRSLGKTWEYLMDRPAAFMVGSSLILVIFYYSAMYAAGLFTLSEKSNIQVAARGTPALLYFITCLCQLAAFARWASYKRPVWVGAGIFAALIPAAYLVNRGAGGGTGSAQFVWLTIVLTILLVALAHAATGSLAALAGNWASLSRQKRSDRRLTRQEMLSRRFELEAKLRRAMDSPGAMRRRSSFKEWARNSPAFPLWTVLYGLGYGMVEVLVVGTISVVMPVSAAPRADLITLFQGVFNLVAFLLFGVIGYYSGGVWRGVVSGVVASGGRILSTIIPVGIYGVGFLRGEARKDLIYLLILGAVVMGLFGGAAGQIDRKSARARRLGANDPAALLAEIIRLERRLRAGQQAACVMAVDVARSTLIKADADPLAVEFSFREYQRLVSRVTQRFGGEVFSTAGDGALASFPSAEDALRAAKSVQTDINEFNETVNRLNHPFRLRIGLHAGQTQAEFSEAPFNELIDVAAHVESASPVGGIACTEAFRRLVEEEPMAEVATAVDGHRVSIVLTPVNVA